MNYTELKAAVAEFLNRDDLTATIPTFVTLAEAQMNRTVRHWKGEQRVSLSLQGRYTDLPPDYMEMIRLAVDGPLSVVTVDKIDQMHRANPGYVRPPCYYSIAGGQVEVFPESTDTAEMRYYSRIPTLSDVEQTNWLIDLAPDVYLYGSLIASAPYLAEDNRLTTWAALYEAAVNAINADGRRGRYGTKLVMRNA